MDRELVNARARRNIMRHRATLIAVSYRRQPREIGSSCRSVYADACTIQSPTRVADDSRDASFDEPTLLKDCKFVSFTFFISVPFCTYAFSLFMIVDEN